MEERNKRVLVGMSGGIDSTATCLLSLIHILTLPTTPYV